MKKKNQEESDHLTQSELLKEKIVYKGIPSLTDTELLAIILGRGDIRDNDLEKAKQLLTSHPSLDGVFLDLKLSLKSSVSTLMCAVGELSSRMHNGESEMEMIDNFRDVEQVMQPILKNAQSEEFWVIALNRASKVVDKRCISRGGVSTSIVDIKLFMKYVIDTLASSVVIVHNHPSGETNPSESDLLITQKIKSALSFFDIVLLDHVIIGRGKSYSFRENDQI